MTRENRDDYWTYGKPEVIVDPETGQEETITIAYAPRNFIIAAQEVIQKTKLQISI